MNWIISWERLLAVGGSLATYFFAFFISPPLTSLSPRIFPEFYNRTTMVPRFHRHSSCLDKFSLLKSVIKLESSFSFVQCDSWVVNELFINDRIIAYSTSCHPWCLKSESGRDLQKKMEIVKIWKNVKLGEDPPLKLCFLFMTIKKGSICLAFYILPWSAICLNADMWHFANWQRFVDQMFKAWQQPDGPDSQTLSGTWFSRCWYCISKWIMCFWLWICGTNFVGGNDWWPSCPAPLQKLQ